MELPVPVIAGIVDPIMNVMFDLIMIMIAMSMNEMLKMRMIGIDYVSYECGRVMRLNMMVFMTFSMMIDAFRYAMIEDDDEEGISDNHDLDGVFNDNLMMCSGMA